MRKGLGLESGGLPLCRPLLPWGPGRVSGPAAVPGKGRREKEADEVDGQTVSGKCCSRLFSWLRSRPETLGVTISRDKLLILPTDAAAMLDGVGSATAEATGSDVGDRKHGGTPGALT